MTRPVVFLELKDSTMNEITTRAEQPPGPTEPRLSLSELRGLLREAAAYERAANPALVVVHAAPQPATMPQGAPAGASVFIPAPPVQPYTTAAVLPPEKRSIMPLLFVSSMVGVIASGYACAASGSSIAVAAVTAFAGIWGLATYRLVFCREA